MDALDALGLCLSHLGTHLDVMEGIPDLKSTTPKYAYVTLVMKGDFYIPGALVVASSLRRTKAEHDIICMVTSDVSKKGRKALKHVYDKVIDVEYISQPYTHLNTAKEENMYHNWMREALTLYRCLWLFDYTKVCLLDSDVVVIRNMDHIFDLNAPAGSFHSFWLQGTHNPYPRNLKHGDHVPTECIKTALQMENSFVCIGNCLLIPPSPQTANAFMSYIDKFVSRHNALGFHKCNSGANEQTIAHFFACHMAMPWTHIGTPYQCIPWKYSPSDPEGSPYLFHYFNIKPWVMNISEFSDLQVWWSFAKTLCDKHPEIISLFPAVSRGNIAPDTAVLMQNQCLWCKGRHQFIDFHTSTITCPHINAVTEP
jgi:hypothetical protein